MLLRNVTLAVLGGFGCPEASEVFWACRQKWQCFPVLGLEQTGWGRVIIFGLCMVLVRELICCSNVHRERGWMGAVCREGLEVSHKSKT